MNQHETPNVNLRAMEPEDLDMLYRIENDIQLWDVGSTSVPYSRYTLHDYIANSANDIYTDRQVRLVIEDADKNPVGLADLTNFDPRHNRAEVGIVIDRLHRRCGYARAALGLIHRYGFHTLHLHQLYAIVASDNKPALALFQSLDYKHTATLDDWLYDGKNYGAAYVMQILL